MKWLWKCKCSGPLHKLHHLHGVKAHHQRHGTCKTQMQKSKIMVVGMDWCKCVCSLDLFYYRGDWDGDLFQEGKARGMSCLLSVSHPVQSQPPAHPSCPCLTQRQEEGVGIKNAKCPSPLGGRGCCWGVCKGRGVKMPIFSSWGGARDDLGWEVGGGVRGRVGEEAGGPTVVPVCSCLQARHAGRQQGGNQRRQPEQHSSGRLVG